MTTDITSPALASHKLPSGNRDVRTRRVKRGVEVLSANGSCALPRVREARAHRFVQGGQFFVSGLRAEHFDEARRTGSDRRDRSVYAAQLAAGAGQTITTLFVREATIVQSAPCLSFAAAKKRKGSERGAPTRWARV